MQPQFVASGTSIDVPATTTPPEADPSTQAPTSPLVSATGNNVDEGSKLCRLPLFQRSPAATKPLSSGNGLEQKQRRPSGFFDGETPDNGRDEVETSGFSGDGLHGGQIWATSGQ
ncbi:hypothetical protein DM860_000936 [Cuscuta australis]|uniref:Uncharacterized protein n=1 Tax=Cuscuta australis TaxID=267555 RepID=A0A328DTC5_9ASTE|nr:hypothetical protein DM860_000936 [Cuscuta australis]